MWFDATEHIKRSDDQMLDWLKECRNQIVLLDGPTGCGKTRLLRRVKEGFGEGMMILAVDRLGELLMKGAEPVRECLGGHDVICIEDADMMQGKIVTQETTARYLSEAARHALVAVTGIRLRERVGTLLDGLKGPVRLIEFRE